MNQMKEIPMARMRKKSDVVFEPLWSTREFADHFGASITAVSTVMRSAGIEAVTRKIRSVPKQMYPKRAAMLAMLAAGFKE